MRKGKDSQPPVIPPPTTSRAHYCDLFGLLCASCQVGKGTKTSSGAIHTTDVKPGAFKVDNLIPGQHVSTDQYVSKVKGWLPHTRGKEKSAHMYMGGTIFVDNMTSVMSVSNQAPLIASDMIQAKQDFERFSNGY
eukprot:94986-Ditylum_brightwellii.AAC.1